MWRGSRPWSSQPASMASPGQLLAIIPNDKSDPAQYAPRLLEAAAAITAASIPAPRSASTSAKPS